MTNPYPHHMSEADEISKGKTIHFDTYTLDDLGFRPLLNSDGTPKKVATLMTAREWHVKFCEEIDKLSDQEKADVMAVFGCAKKVAGLK